MSRVRVAELHGGVQGIYLSFRTVNGWIPLHLTEEPGATARYDLRTGVLVSRESAARVCAFWQSLFDTYRIIDGNVCEVKAANDGDGTSICWKMCWF